MDSHHKHDKGYGFYVHKNKRHQRHLLDNLWDLYREGLLCDTTITLGDIILKCHKIVLCAASRSILESVRKCPSDKRTKTMHIHVKNPEEFSIESVQIFMESLYTGRLAISSIHALAVSKLAEQFHVDWIKEVCNGFLKVLRTLPLPVGNKVSGRKVNDSGHVNGNSNQLLVPDSPIADDVVSSTQIKTELEDFGVSGMDNLSCYSDEEVVEPIVVPTCKSSTTKTLFIKTEPRDEVPASSDITIKKEFDSGFLPAMNNEKVHADGSDKLLSRDEIKCEPMFEDNNSLEASVHVDISKVKQEPVEDSDASEPSRCNTNLNSTNDIDMIDNQLVSPHTFSEERLVLKHEIKTEPVDDVPEINLSNQKANDSGFVDTSVHGHDCEINQLFTRIKVKTEPEMDMMEESAIPYPVSLLEATGSVYNQTGSTVNKAGSAAEKPEWCFDQVRYSFSEESRQSDMDIDDDLSNYMNNDINSSADNSRCSSVDPLPNSNNDSRSSFYGSMVSVGVDYAVSLPSWIDEKQDRGFSSGSDSPSSSASTEIPKQVEKNYKTDITSNHPLLNQAQEINGVGVKEGSFESSSSSKFGAKEILESSIKTQNLISDQCCFEPDDLRNAQKGKSIHSTPVTMPFKSATKVSTPVTIVFSSVTNISTSTSVSTPVSCVTLISSLLSPTKNKKIILLEIPRLGSEETSIETSQMHIKKEAFPEVQTDISCSSGATCVESIQPVSFPVSASHNLSQSASPVETVESLNCHSCKFPCVAPSSTATFIPNAMTKCTSSVPKNTVADMNMLPMTTIPSNFSASGSRWYMLHGGAAAGSTNSTFRQPIVHQVPEKYIPVGVHAPDDSSVSDVHVVVHQLPERCMDVRETDSSTVSNVPPVVHEDSDSYRDVGTRGKTDFKVTRGRTVSNVLLSNLSRGDTTSTNLRRSECFSSVDSVQLSVPIDTLADTNKRPMTIVSSSFGASGTGEYHLYGTHHPAIQSGVPHVHDTYLRETDGSAVSKIPLRNLSSGETSSTSLKEPRCSPFEQEQLAVPMNGAADVNYLPLTVASSHPGTSRTAWHMLHGAAAVKMCSPIMAPGVDKMCDRYLNQTDGSIMSTTPFSNPSLDETTYTGLQRPEYTCIEPEQPVSCSSEPNTPLSIPDVPPSIPNVCTRTRGTQSRSPVVCHRTKPNLIENKVPRHLSDHACYTFQGVFDQNQDPSNDENESLVEHRRSSVAGKDKLPEDNKRKTRSEGKERQKDKLKKRDRKKRKTAREEVEHADIPLVKAESWDFGLDKLWQNKPQNFEAEQKFNCVVSVVEPYCCICALFRPFSGCDGTTDSHYPKPGRREPVLPSCSSPLIPEWLFSSWSLLDILYPVDTDTSIISTEESQLLMCRDCKICVHASCYGITREDTLETSMWICARCEDKNSAVVKCCLCNLRGGALKPTTDGRWAHVTCALAIKEVKFKDVRRRQPIDASNIPQARTKLKCTYCSLMQTGSPGTCVQCSYGRCLASFHVTCGHLAGATFKPGNPRIFPVYITCTKHSTVKRVKQKLETSRQLNKLKKGTKVYAKHKNCRYYVVEVAKCYQQEFYEVEFAEEGTFSNDVYPDDIQNYNCLRDGAPDIGASVRVKWSDGGIYTGVFRGTNSQMLCKVIFEDGLVKDCRREEVWDLGEAIPKNIKSRLSEASESKYNFDHEKNKKVEGKRSRVKPDFLMVGDPGKVDSGKKKNA